MRESREPRAVTRQRIRDAASILFRRDGIDGVGVDAVMREAGLTHGGFYGHFASKEALVAEVCAGTLADSAIRWARVRGEHDAPDALRLIVERYLTAPPAGEQGCVLPSLAAELARRPGARPAVTDALRAMIDTLAHCLPDPPEAAREKALAGLSAMVGAVALARLSSDPALAAELRAAARGVLLPAAAPSTDP